MSEVLRMQGLVEEARDMDRTITSSSSLALCGSDIVMRIGGKLMNKKRLSSKSINFYKAFILVKYIYYCCFYLSDFIYLQYVQFQNDLEEYDSV